MKATKEQVLKYLHEKLALNEDASTWEVLAYIKLKLCIGNRQLSDWRKWLEDEGHIVRTITKMDIVRRVK